MRQRAALSTHSHSPAPHWLPTPRRMGRSGAARTSENAARGRELPGSPQSRTRRQAGPRGFKCALRALAAAVRRRTSRARRLQPAGRARSWGVCARSRGVPTHKGVFAKYTTRVYPPLGLEQGLRRHGRRGVEGSVKFPSSAEMREREGKAVAARSECV